VNKKAPEKNTITLSRIRQLEKELEKADAEMDVIIRKYYATPGAQNVGDGIGQISKLHATLVEQLADTKRELRRRRKP
jgi:hypothetical protein